MPYCVFYFLQALQSDCCTRASYWDDKAYVCVSLRNVLFSTFYNFYIDLSQPTIASAWSNDQKQSLFKANFTLSWGKIINVYSVHEKTLL